MLTLSEIEHFLTFGFVHKKGLISKDLLVNESDYLGKAARKFSPR